MSQVINTNVASLNAQRSLGTSQGSLATSLQRLSSGLRINSAKDDAAGLAISERFTTQIRGVNQAVRNANDAISLAQTAEGAMTQISSNLQRIRELAVQAVNATNSERDRAALDAEAQQLKQEIDRVAAQSEFNGTRLLDGGFSGQAYQVGANAGQLLTLPSLQSLRLADVRGADGFRVDAPAGTTVGTSLPLSIDVSTLIFDQDADSEREAQDAFMQAVAAAFDAAPISSATYDAASGDLTIRNVGWASLIVGLDNIGGTTADLGFGQSLVMNVSSLSLAVVPAESTIDSVSLATPQSATLAIAAMDRALETVNGQRAQVGALQNRFESVIANLQTTSENLTTSRSRIQDADFATETASLVRDQILQQAGTTMLVQANALSQNVLSLLR
ncbi:MAG: flagellin [Gammaproteobacteria bacterium]|nr:flagellin [Gammaproteobacteria bacterium]